MALTKQILLLIFVYGFVISVTCKKVTPAPDPAPIAALTQFKDGEVIPIDKKHEPFESPLPAIAGLAPTSPDEEDYDTKDKKEDGSKDEEEDNGDSMDEKEDDSKDEKEDNSKDKKDSKDEKEDNSKDKKEDKPEDEEEDDSKDEKEDESRDKKNDDSKDKKEEDSKDKKKDDSNDEKEGDSKNKKEDDPKDDKKDHPKMNKEGDSKDEKKGGSKDKKEGTSKEKKKNESKDKTKDSSKAEKEGESKDEIEDGSTDEKEGDVATVVGNQMRKIEKKIHEFSTSLKEQMNSPKSHECCLECDEVLGAALDDIKRTLDSLANDNLVKANFDVSAITTNVDTCNECFEEMVGGDPKAKKLTDYVQKTTGDALEALKNAES
ncbi:uncharacterized protein LOC143539868 [Bidens hawaiensis]|uniref:uncharacterized protein LOC143539868 n=1 Tax=Bidens hawaiensis TaxID=980011 RepID=UPI0040491A3A